MSDTTVRWREATDDEFLALVRMFALGARWLFVESATQCDLKSSHEAQAADFEVARLWQLRLFNETFELYGRRLSYGPQGRCIWRVRYVGDTPLWDETGWKAHPERPTSAGSYHIRLLGYAIGNGDAFASEAPQGIRGSQPAARYFPHGLQYPGHDWQPGQQVQLTVKEYQLSDGALNRWAAIEPVPKS